MSAYVDASAFLAIINSSDQKHASSVSVWQDLLDREEHLITSNYVLLEIIALIHNRLGTEVVHKFLGDLMPVVELVWADVSDHQSAVSAMLTHPGKGGPSIVDCMSFHVIKQRRIQYVFAYDRHFSEQGFNLIG